MGDRPNLVGRGSGKTQRRREAIGFILLRRNARPIGVPSRGVALCHGSDFATRCLVLDYGAEGYVGQVGAFFNVTERVS